MDTNAGTSAATAWLTIGKALGTTGIASGDTVYVGAGRYPETVSVAMTSPTVETRVIGDGDGLKTGDAGPVVWTAYTSGDAAAAAASPTLNLNGRDFLTFEKFFVVGGAPASSGNCVLATTLTSTNIVFRDCDFTGFAPAGGRPHIAVTNAPDIALAWLIDRCTFFGGYGNGILVDGSDSAGASDYDIDFTIQNSVLIVGSGASFGVRFEAIDGGGVGLGKPGGGKVHNCVIFGMSGVQVINLTGNGWSTATPAACRNSLVLGTGGDGLRASVSGQLVEDFNIICSASARVNVTPGANSKVQTNQAVLLHFGQELMMGMMPRLFLMPFSHVSNGTLFPSQVLGFGSDPAVSLGVDALNRPRPAGGESVSKAVGAFERHDTATKDTGIIDAGDHIVIVGPGDHDVPVQVAAAATVLSIKVRYDTNHGITNKPQVTLLANGELGVVTETKTATVGVDTTETLTFTSFTPSKVGRVVLRCVSRAAAGTGKAWFDSIGVA